MTARDLELQKLARLIELAKIKEAKEKMLITKFSVVKSASGDEMEFEFEGDLLEIIAVAMTGLHHLETIHPEAKMFIEAAFEGRRILRDQEE